MIEIHEELEHLRASLFSGDWQPTDQEQEVALLLQRADHLTAATLRAALPDSRRPLFAALDRVSAVLDLPPVHEDPGTRQQLVTALRNLLQAVASGASS